MEALMVIVFFCYVAVAAQVISEQNKNNSFFFMGFALQKNFYRKQCVFENCVFIVINE